jgi:signal transduction histidine kinase
MQKAFYNRFFVLLSAFIFLAAATARVGAQGLPFMLNYTAKDYGANPLIWMMVQDSRGLLYLANNDGVLVYDGVKWKLVPTPNQVRSLAIDAKDVVYVGCKGDFGVLQINLLDELEFVSYKKNLTRTEQQEVKDIDRVFVSKRAVYFNTPEKIYAAFIDNNLVQIRPLPLKTRSTGTIKLGDDLYVNADQGLGRFNDGKLTPIAGGDVFKGKEIISATAANKGVAYIGTYEHGIYVYQGGRFSPFKTEADGYFKQYKIYDLAVMPSGKIVVATMTGGFAVVGADGRILQYYRTDNGFPNDDMFAIFVDRQSMVWAGHNKGLTRVAVELPLTSYAQLEGLEGNIFATLLFKNRLYVTTRQGVFYLDLARPSAFGKVPGINKDSWELAVANGRLLVATNDGVADITDGRAAYITNNEIAIRLRQSSFDANRLYVGTLRGIDLLAFKGGRWAKGGKVEGFEQEVQSLLEIDKNNVWVGLAGNGLAKVTLEGDKEKATVKRYGPNQGLPEGGIEVAELGGKTIFRSGNGVFAYSASEKFEKLDALSAIMPRKTTRFVEDKNGNLWLTTDRGLAQALKQADKTYKLNPVSPANILQQKPDNLYLEGNNLWFVNQDQLFSINLATQFKPEPLPPPLIRNINFGTDSTYFRGTFLDENDVVVAQQTKRYTPNLPINLNNLSFSVGSPVFDNERYTLYQFMLEGFDKDWRPYSTNPTVDFTNLDPGNYVFKARAQNALGQESEPATFTFTIKTPWYLTLYAYVGYGLALLLLIFLAVRINGARLEAANRKLEAVVLERTKEVNRQKDEIEKKASDLVAANDEIKNKQAQLIQSEKMASLGQLVAGVAHEINTPLGAINAAAGNISKSLQPTFNDLPMLVKSMDPATEKLFFALVERSINFTGNLTSSDERNHRKTVTKTLEENGVEGAGSLAQSLVKIGVFEGVDQFLPLFKHADSKKIVDLASGMGRVRMNIDNIELASAKMQKIVFALKSYSHKQAEDILTPSSVSQNVDTVLTIYHNQLKYGVTVQRNFAENLPDILCYPDELNQVWTNILVNALQAMENKGTFTIDINRKGDKHIEVRMTDSGPGIPAHVLPRIFEPFYTTKKQGEGTGLGLDIVRKIVADRHRGAISVDTEPGRTTFIIVLPINPMDEPAPAGKKAEGAPVPNPAAA